MRRFSMLEAQLFPPLRQFRLDLGLDRSQLLRQHVELRGHDASFGSVCGREGLMERPPMQLASGVPEMAKIPAHPASEGCQSRKNP